MDLTQIYQRNEQLVYREEEDGAFLFNPDTGNLKYMNRTGREIYLSLGDKCDINGLINHQLEFFPGVERRRIEKDIEGFLKELEENGFISSLNDQ
ncbi:MAG: PqqD family protein [Deltaproteobacteria bacterium]|nr:PqqD family protein [Deltaproteobacteria bacterium]